MAASGQPEHVSLPGVHRLFSLTKRLLEGTYQGSAQPDHLQAHLNKFVFRFNRHACHKRGMLFFRLLEAAVAGSPARTRTSRSSTASRWSRRFHRRPHTSSHEHCRENQPNALSEPSKSRHHGSYMDTLYLAVMPPWGHLFSTVNREPHRGRRGRIRRGTRRGRG